MNKVRLTVWVATVALLVSAVNSWAVFLDASTLGTNITTVDGIENSTWDGGSPALGIGGEDNETERIGNTVTYTYQSWDLEGIYWNRAEEKLTVIGGFNYLTGNSGEAAGDFFIGDNTVLDFSRNGDNLFAEGTFTTVQDYTDVVEPSDIPTSTPYQYLDGGTVVDATGTYSAGYIQNWNELGLGLAGWKSDDKHFALVINTEGTAATSLINAGNDLHFTLECGNDLITGQAQAVPEPSSIGMLLVGMSLLSLVAWKKNR
jgi:hypothetical protein